MLKLFQLPLGLLSCGTSFVTLLHFRVKTVVSNALCCWKHIALWWWFLWIKGRRSFCSGFKVSSVCRDASRRDPFAACWAPESLQPFSTIESLTLAELIPMRHGPKGVAEKPVTALALNSPAQRRMTASGVKILLECSVPVTNILEQRKMMLLMFLLWKYGKEEGFFWWNLQFACRTLLCVYLDESRASALLSGGTILCIFAHPSMYYRTYWFFRDCLRFVLVSAWLLWFVDKTSEFVCFCFFSFFWFCILQCPNRFSLSQSQTKHQMMAIRTQLVNMRHRQPIKRTILVCL